MSKKTVVLGLSGGVDSACAAVALRGQGYDVAGAFLAFSGSDDGAARHTARQLGIDFIRIDMTEALERQVIEPFVCGYARGTTPIPCVLCNPSVKFRLLFELADRLGAAFVATGHYARTGRTESGPLPFAGAKRSGLYAIPAAVRMDWTAAFAVGAGAEQSGHPRTRKTGRY